MMVRVQPELSAVDPSTPRVLIILGSILEGLMARNEKLMESGSLSSSSGSVGVSLVQGQELGTNLNVFHGVRAPSISIGKYLERLYKYTNCSPSCFVVGYVYIDRLLHKHPEMLISSLSVHRLLVTSLLIASKMLDDVQYNNAFYARIGGVSNMELNRLELELLFLLDFEVMVSSPVFESYCCHLEKEMMRRDVTTRIEKAPALYITDDVSGIAVEEQGIASLS
ncbi:hypothetical protein Cgig2_025038 [Carnegiea gigantea]|uniref:Cyclin n=1 Tax=Carnegiea gigantea TaxID=171969 RepID=A0A9Q1K1D3_9CARY|nr:hypothetical protein Cgig2_025038 [Carnegiea gigantea]